MKHLIPVVALLFALPPAAHAQIDIRLPTGALPSVRATVGPLSVSATVGARGLDVRVGERPAASPTRPVPSSSGPPRPAAPAGAPRATASGVLASADAYLGTPYVWGGSTPAGFDCSGFVQYIFRRHGVALPRTSRQQAQVGQRIPTALHALRPGDLMFFATNGSQIDHIAIYAGDDWIIHSSSSGGGVGYDHLGTRRGEWFSSHHVATRRVLADGRSLAGELDTVLRLLTGIDPPDRAPGR